MAWGRFDLWGIWGLPGRKPLAAFVVAVTSDDTLVSWLDRAPRHTVPRAGKPARQNGDPRMVIMGKRLS